MGDVLQLTLFREWFDQILSGEKVEEYREIKEYWTRRLFVGEEVREYDSILFRNGYGSQRPWMRVEFRGVRVDRAENRYAILLGDVVESGNV